MQFERLTEIDTGIIDQLCDSGSIFSHPSFATVWSAQGGKPVWWVARHDGQVSMVLPGVEFGRRPVTRFQAMPDGCYADPVGVSLSPQLLAALRRDGYLRGIIYDFDSRFPMLPGITIDGHCSRVVDISSPDWEPPDSNLRSEIRKAARDGVTVRKLKPESDLPRVVELAKANADHHGQVMRYRPSFYDALAGLAKDSPLVRWYVAEYDNGIIASHIYLVHHQQLVYWQANVDRDYADRRPNQFITDTAIREGRVSGLTKLNLGATPPHAEGLHFYKQRWGGEEVHYRSLRWQSFLGRML